MTLSISRVLNNIDLVIGYSEGEFRANDRTFTSGGQCEDGLKMMVIIGEVEVPTSDGIKCKNQSIESVIYYMYYCIIMTLYDCMPAQL